MSPVAAPALVGLAELEAAAARIARVAVRTPLLQFDAASATAWAWLPDEGAITPRPRSSGVSCARKL